MGLSLTELLMATEEEFRIDLDQVEYAEIETAGGLADYVLYVLEKRHGAGKYPQPRGMSPEQRALNNVRRAFAQVVGVEPTTLTTEKELETLIPLANREQTWRAIQTQLFPNNGWLRCAPRLAVSLVGMSLLPTVVAFLDYEGTWVCLSVCVTSLALIVSWVLCMRFRTRFPRNVRTIADVVRLAQQHDSNAEEEFLRRCEAPDRHEFVWERIRELTAMKLDVPIDSVARDARFIEDLGAD
jgi:hypothetical protein